MDDHVVHGDNSLAISPPLPVTMLAPTPLTKQAFAHGMAIVTAHFPNFPLPEQPSERQARLQIMYENLRDLTPQEFERGVRTFCRAHRELYPGTNVIANIRRYAKGHHVQTSPEEAWRAVLAEVRRVGSWGTPQFRDPLVAQAVKAVGWLAICQSELIGVERAHFSKAYAACQTRDNFATLTGERQEQEEEHG